MRTPPSFYAHITAQSVDPMAATIGAPDARLRAALAGAMLMGIVSQRYILRMPDVMDADVEDILRLITPLLQALLDPDTTTSYGQHDTRRTYPGFAVD